MDKKKPQKDYVKNVFKSSDCLDKRQFSDKWVELINRLENSWCVKK